MTIERQTRTGGEVKICKECKVPFIRNPRMKQLSWDKTLYCPKHSRKDSRPPEPILGKYIVNNPLIDKFLRG